MRYTLPCLAVVIACGLARGDTPDPLQFVPKEAALVLKVEKPRQLVESVLALDVYREYETLPQVRELLDSTTAKRFFQLLHMAESKLDQTWPALLDSLAGGGMALGTVPGGNNAPVLLVVQGTDAEKSAEAFELMKELIAAELGRLSPPGQQLKPDVGTANGADVMGIGKDFFAAHFQGTLLISNNKGAIERGVRLATGAGDAESVLTNENLPAAKRLLGEGALAWFWFDLKKAKEDQGFRDFLETARKQGFLLFVLGSTVDAVRRADFVTAGLFKTSHGFQFRLRLPAKRADLPPVMALHAPLKGETHGSLPTLEPPGVLYSQSMYLDIASFWNQRKTALGEQELKDFEQFVTQISRVLPGTSLPELLEGIGPHYRLVMVERGENQYKAAPDFPLPEMALAISLKDPKVGPKLATTIRTAAALLSLQLGLKMSEEKVDDVNVVSYRFPDEKTLADDPTNIRYNFVPSFALVGDSLLVATSPKLLRELLPELKKPIDSSACSPAVWRANGYGAGAALATTARPETAVADAVLNQGVGLDEARRQLDQLAALLKKVGTLGVSIDHGDQAFKFDIDWQLKK